MMPKWVCNKCGHEFYGWGVYYKYKIGNVLLCPECEGHLVHPAEESKGDGDMTHASDSDAA